jgi:RHS repeat-associated protein
MRRRNFERAHARRLLWAGWAAGLGFLLVACTAEGGTTAVQRSPRPTAAAAARQSDRPAPKQRWGNAAGLDPVAGKSRNTFRPPSLKSKYPPVKAPALPANTAKVVAAPAAPKATGFRRNGGSREIPTRRGANQRTYANPDGTETTEYSTSPVNYRKPDGSWAPIDSRLVADPAGGWRRDADSVTLGIAGRADAAELVRVTFPGGGVLAYGAAGARPVTGTATGDTARFAGVWTDTDVELQSQPGMVKETLVLGSARAPVSYVFPLRLTGLTATLADNQVVLRNPGGATVGTIPAGYLVDAASKVSKAVTYHLIQDAGAPALRVSIDRGWLSAADRRFPVRLDPPVLGNGAATEALVVQGSGSHGGGGDLAVGRRNGVNSASYLRFPGLVSDLARQTIFSAQLSLAAFEAPSCKPRQLGVYPVTGSWSSATSTSYPGPAVGGALASLSFAQGYVRLGQPTSACPVTGTVIDLGTKGRDLVQGWADGKPNNGISLRAPVSDESAWKTIAGTGSANPPRLYVTHTPYNAKYTVPSPIPKPAVLQNQAGKVKVTVTNKSAMDWTPSGFQLVYRAYNASTSAKVGQYVAAALPGNVARGASVTLDATIRPLPVGTYLIDFSMATTSGKVFTDEMVPPARIALRVDNIPPTVGELFPPNGYQSPTLTPQLWAQAVDLDAPPSQTLQYKFEYCSVDTAGAPTGCTQTAYQAKQSFTIPAAKLKWSTTYLWRAFVKDNTDEVASGYAALVTAVPQPVITSRVANAPYGNTDREFNPDIGNYTTAAVDATVATAGPKLNITRSYNSLDPRRGLAFGAGWMSGLDMRAALDADGSGNMLITYADGQQVRFGRNADGTFAAPPGRTATLTITNGAYVLNDVAGTTYTFRGSDGRIATVADKYARTLEFVYNLTDGKLKKIQWHAGPNVTTGRALAITWNTAGTHVASVTTDPVGGRTLTWTYQYNGDLLTGVCAPGGQICTTYTYAAGSHYRTSVLDSGPDSYWRLGEKAGAASAGSEILNNLGKDAATLRNVTLEQPGAPAGATDTAALFDGTSSVAELPKGVLKRSRETSVELWFKVTQSQTGGPLIGYQDKAVDTTPTSGVPLLYVDLNGHVRGQFKTTASTPKPIDGGADLRDAKWHHVVLSVTGDVQTLYVDGARKGTKPATDGAVDHGLLTFNQAGAGWATTPASWPSWGSTAKRYFNGSLDEVAVYGHTLSDQAVLDHWTYGSAQADLLAKVTMASGKISSETTFDAGGDRIAEYTDGNGGTWKIGQPTVYGNDTDLRRAVQVLDPANRAYLYEYDALAGRLLRSGSPLGVNTRPEDRPPSPAPSPTPSPTQTCTQPDPSYPTFCTTIPDDSSGDPVFVEHELSGMVVRSFGYDAQGRQNQIVDENGNTVTMTFDSRGNVASRKSCRAAGDCQTSYTSYTTPNASNPLDPRNDLPIEVRDPRSSSATDTNYRTVTDYNYAGDVLKETGPDSSVVAKTYTNGTELAYGSTTENVPAGLIATATDPAGKVARYRYTPSGDLALETMPTGLVTEHGYDALGRPVSLKVTSDSYPSGVITTFAYDDLGRPTTTTGPVSTNAVDGTKHQAVTTKTYDVDSNVVQTSIRDALDTTEPPRITTIEYDDYNRQTRTVNPEGDEQTEGWDQFGNRTSVVDGNGNHYEYAYTATNKLSEVRLYDFHDDGTDDGGAYVVLNSYAYDFGGRMAVQVDSMGRRLEYTYLGDDLLSKVVQKNFHNPDGSTRDFVVESNTYDAAGNVTKSVLDNGASVTTNEIDKMGRIKSTTVDPGGVNRVNSYEYDLIGNVTKSTASGIAVNVPWAVEATATNVVTQVYNPATGRLDQEKTVDGSTSRVVSYTYDQRGYVLTKTDPRGNVSGADKAAFTTTYRYDENGDQTTVIAPAVSVENTGGTAQTANPTAITGYNAFGEVVAVKDPLGNISHTKYDRMGRVVEVDGPGYAAPGGPSTAQSPVKKTTYDALGNIATVTDARQHVTSYTYDRLNRLVKTDAPGPTDSDRMITTRTYTRSGRLLSTTGPTGIRTEATYDDLDRQVTSTAFERKPVARTLTTTVTYNDAGDPIKTTSPTGLVTAATYDKAGDQLSVTSQAGVTTQQGYDGFGNPVRQSDGAGRTTRRDYDKFGAVVAERNLDPAGTELRKETYTYNENGNLTARTDALNKTVSFTYDALDHLVKQVEPKSATESITTSWGYNAAGNRTRYTDGRGNSTYYGVNTLGLAESVTEPSTTAHPALTDRMWTVAYDLNGNATTLTAPGGVVRTREYDAANRMIAESGSGGGAAAATRGITYDLAGRPTAITAGSTSNTFDYNDRGDLLAATASSGNATFGYDDEGQLTSRTDAAGSASFGYTKGRITTQKDGASGVTQTLGYDAAGLVKTVDYGSGRVRSYGFDDLGRLSSDTLKNGSGATVSSITYKYDLDDHITGKDTTGTAAAGSNTYGYDDAGRLTSWTSSAGTVGYAWDDAGNRIKAGAKTASYDQRNRLLSDGDYAYAYTPRGTVASRTKPGTTDQYSFDAFDRLIAAEGQSYVYDGLDRVINRNGTLFQYSGAGQDPVGDGVETYGRDPDGDLLSVARAGSGAKLTMSDGHEDVVGAFAAEGSLTALDSSTAYDPFGNPTAFTGTRARVGFQGDWTDPDTGQVDMGSRWYEPDTGTFVSRDSADYSSGNSVLANKYAYGADDPLGNNDPTGNWPSCGWCKRAAKAVGSGLSTAYHYTANAVYHAAVSTGSWLYNQARAGWGALQRGWDAAVSATRNVLHRIGNAIVNTWNNKIVPAWRSAKNAALAKAREVVAQARAVTAQAKAKISYAVQHVSLKGIATMVTAKLKSITVTVSAMLPPKLVQNFTSVVQDLRGAASDLYAAAAAANGALLSGVRAAGTWVVDHKADIIGGIAGGVVGLGCGLAIGITGVGAVACAAAAGAVGSLVTDLVEGGKGWKEMAGDALLGAVTGAVLGPIAEIGGAGLGGAVRGLIRGGLREAVGAGTAAVSSAARSFGNAQIGGLAGRMLANRAAGSAGREAVETAGASAASSARAAAEPKRGGVPRRPGVRPRDEVDADDPWNVPEETEKKRAGAGGLAGDAMDQTPADDIGNLPQTVKSLVDGAKAGGSTHTGTSVASSQHPVITAVPGAGSIDPANAASLIVAAGWTAAKWWWRKRR